jgi:hypothetical protein
MYTSHPAQAFRVNDRLTVKRSPNAHHTATPGSKMAVHSNDSVPVARTQLRHYYPNVCSRAGSYPTMFPPSSLRYQRPIISEI